MKSMLSRSLKSIIDLPLKGSRQFQASFYGQMAKRNDTMSERSSFPITEMTLRLEVSERKNVGVMLPYRIRLLSMQQDAANKINFGLVRLWWWLSNYMKGINIGSGVQGLITYMLYSSAVLVQLRKMKLLVHCDRLG